ncbi:hypothetical protein NSS79_15430 [Paenibacillus sp. FSL L8-0436]|uniref:phage adaptor protein n=1 Tax=Paenibacillus sp. FSL L8-0436 TaxID=2954686 RepID=UPI003158CB21
MNVQEILGEIDEKYPHGLSNSSLIRKINLVQNEVFRLTFKNPMLSIFSLIKGVHVYQVPFPRTNLLRAVVGGHDYSYQNIYHKSNHPYYYWIGNQVLAINPTPKDDVADGLALFHYKYPIQVTEDDLDAVPELDEDFHMLLVYGVLVQICEVFQDTAMVNNYTGKYNALLEELQKIYDKMIDSPQIQNVWGLWG